MASLSMILTCQKSADTMVEQYERPTSAKYPTVQSLSDLLSMLVSGNLFRGGSTRPQVVVSVVENEVHASATFTLTSVIATDAVVINGVTLTCVASGAVNNEFNVGMTDNATATNLAEAINTSTTGALNLYVSASAALNVVTVTAKAGGISGNTITFVSNDGTIVANHARLTGGAADPGLKTYQF